MTLDLDVASVPRDELPSLLGRLAELEARARLRLAEPVQATTPRSTSTPIDAAAAASIAGTKKRWLLEHTRGLSFRCDLSRKQPRFAEAGLRAWLAARRRP